MLQSGIVCKVWERHFKTSWNIMKSLNVAPFYFVLKNNRGKYKVRTQIYEKKNFSFIHMAAYFLKMNECFWHGALFLWQPQHFKSIGCLSNTVAMVTFTRFLRKMIANLIDKICYYASRMNYPSLKDNQKLWFLTLFKSVLLNIGINVVRSLLSAGGHILI